MTIKVQLSGHTYHFFVAPNTSSFLTEDDCDIPLPTRRKAGRGATYVFPPLRRDQAEDILWHLETLLDSSSGWDPGPESSRDRAALRSDIARIRKALG